MVELIWTFDYIKLGEEIIVASSRQYKNGQYVGEADAQDKFMLVSYLALFPSKDIIQVKLGTSQNSLYNIYFFDKRFKNEGFIGVFSFAEYNTSQPFIWGKEENIMLNVFQKFKEAFPNLFSVKIEDESSDLSNLDKLNNYYTWMDKTIKLYYEGWEQAKQEYYGNKSEEMRKNLAQTFSQITSNVPIIQIDTKKIKDKIKLSAKDIVQQGTTISSNEEPNGISEIRDKMIKETLEDNQNIDISKITNEMLRVNKNIIDLNKYSINWDIQLINSFGNPLTGIIRFNDGKLVEKASADEFMSQGLEAMSYSVLKSIAEQKNFDLRYIKASVGSLGIEYNFFQSINFKNNRLVLIMRSAIQNKTTGVFEDLLIGGERLILEKIAYELSNECQDWFENNDYSDIVKKGCEEVSNVFYRICRKYFKENISS